jgi:hypothetical protein
MKKSNELPSESEKKETQLYVPVQRIRYRNPEHYLGGQIVEPGSPEALAGLPFTHLYDKDINLLLAKGIIIEKP